MPRNRRVDRTKRESPAPVTHSGFVPAADARCRQLRRCRWRVHAFRPRVPVYGVRDKCRRAGRRTPWLLAPATRACERSRSRWGTSGPGQTKWLRYSCKVNYMHVAYFTMNLLAYLLTFISALTDGPSCTP